MRIYSINFKDGEVSSIKKVEKDYYDINLYVMASLNQNGFHTDAKMASGINKMELLINFDFDYSILLSEYKNLNKNFTDKVEYVSALKSTIRDNKINEILNENI